MDQDIINGSVLNWQVVCEQCPQKLTLLNHLSKIKEIGTIPNCTYISTTSEYIYIQ
jgi:hypothetical protein